MWNEYDTHLRVDLTSGVIHKDDRFGRSAVVAGMADLVARIDELLAKGFKSFDAFHLATAELSGAVVFLTVDGELLKIASRLSGELHVPVTDPIRFIEEISQWKH